MCQKCVQYDVLGIEALGKYEVAAAVCVLCAWSQGKGYECVPGVSEPLRREMTARLVPGVATADWVLLGGRAVVPATCMCQISSTHENPVRTFMIAAMIAGARLMQNLSVAFSLQINECHLLSSVCVGGGGAMAGRFVPHAALPLPLRGALRTRAQDLQGWDRDCGGLRRRGKESNCKELQRALRKMLCRFWTPSTSRTG